MNHHSLNSHLTFFNFLAMYFINFLKRLLLHLLGSVFPSLQITLLCVFFVCVCVCVLPAGLLNLEQLLRQFLISKETLSVRMLDDSNDPTPLLKEIRDDKTATIIVDANATMSHIILERVSMVHMIAVVIHAPITCLYSMSVVWSSIAIGNSQDPHF